MLSGFRNFFRGSWCVCGDFCLFGDFCFCGHGATDDRRVAGNKIEGVLVEDAGHGLVQIGHFVAEGDGAFEEYFDCYSPELVVVGGRVVTQQIFGAGLALLHGGEDRAGYFGEVGEFFLEVFVFLGLGHEIDVGEGVSHLVETDVAVGGLAGDTLDKIIPGKIDACLVDVAHEGTGIVPVVIVIAEDEDVVEIVELELFEPEGQLHGGGADEDRHLGGRFYLYIVEVLGVLKEIRAKKEFSLFFETKAVVVPEMTGNNGVVECLPGNKTFELMPGVQTLT